MIELRLLGPIELMSADGIELRAVLTHPKRLALLAYLAAARPRGFQRREKLVALLWPEFDQTRARQALNKAIHHLRQSMGDGAIVSRGDDEVAIDDQSVRCDVWQFDHAIGAGSVRAAIELYRGDFADGLFVDDAPDLEQWMSAERERLRAVAARTAGAVVESIQSTDMSAAVEYARRAVALMPYDEAALRRLMLLLARAGDRPGAALAFADFSRRLLADLELEPSAETRALRESLAREEPRTAIMPLPAATPGLSSADTVAELVPTPRRRSRRLAPIMAVALLASFGALLGLNRWSSREVTISRDPRRVFVAPLENRTGDSTLNVVGAMATDWIAQGLSTDDVAHVVRSPDPTAGLVIAGAFYRKGDSLHFQAQLSGSGDARHTRAFHPVVAPAKDPAAALESLRQQALSLVAQATTPRHSAPLRGEARPPLYAAYREYMIGMDLYMRREYALAYDRFTRAAALDTNFNVALLSAAGVAERIGSGHGDSLVDKLTARREQLSPLPQAWLDVMLAQRRGDRAEQLRLLEFLARELPELSFQFTEANLLFALKRSREAAARLRAVDPRSEWMVGFHSYWLMLTMADHSLGDVRSEEQDVLAALRAYPDDPAVATSAVRLFASTGRLVQADSVLDEARSMRPIADWNAGSVFAVAALEGSAHGHRDWAERVRDRAVRWYRELPPAEQKREVGGFGLSWILYSVGAWPELEARVARLAREAPRDARWIALGGLVAANLGDTLRAREADDRLAAMLRIESIAPRRANLLYERARIAAMRGARDEAVDHLRHAFASGLWFSIHMHADPAFASLRSYPPFERVIAPKDQAVGG